MGSKGCAWYLKITKEKEIKKMIKENDFSIFSCLIKHSKKIKHKNNYLKITYFKVIWWLFWYLKINKMIWSSK